MNFFLSLAEVQEHAEQILQELKYIREKKVGKKKADPIYWQLVIFYKDLVFSIKNPFECEKDFSGKIHEANKKLEDGRKQKRGLGNIPPLFALKLLPEKSLPQYLKDENYPSYKGYSLVVAENGNLLERHELLAKTVAEAIDIEFDCYKKVPIKDWDKQTSKLKAVFNEKGEAYRKILATLERRTSKGHTLQNHHNPSTKRLIQVTLPPLKAMIKDMDQAIVRTEEYFYLKWFNEKLGRYAKDTYEEENIQTYQLEWQDDKWMVVKNVYPPEAKNRNRR
jgi:hypothetical protein